MNLELSFKYIFSLHYQLPEKPPVEFQYNLKFDTTFDHNPKDNEIIALYTCQLFNDEFPIMLKFEYCFVFSILDDVDVEKEKDALSDMMNNICIPYLNEFVDYFISKTPLPPVFMAITKTEKNIKSKIKS